ncbi:MAG: hypothetical protein ACXWVJ_07760 [Caulobacteraceae bacterium]
MSRICFVFFGTGALMVLGGMLWGLQMAMSGDHAMAPAHAHLNLIGWASMGVMGAFYGLAGARVPKLLAWANYVLVTAGVLVMIPTLANELAVHGSGGVGLKISPLLVIAGMACFLIAVIIAGLRSRNVSPMTLGSTMPAE